MDPWRARPRATRADLVLVTHAHADHCSPDDVFAVAHETTVAAGPPDVALRLESVLPGRVRTLAEGDVIDLAGARVTALPSAGPPRAVLFHPRGTGLAYLVELAGFRYLVLGDSDALPEHERLAPDVAFFAVSGLTTTDPAEAAAAAARIAPRLAVPVHFGDLHERFPAAARFVALCAERGIAAVAPGHSGSAVTASSGA